MEIIQERIEREFGIELIATAPSVIYQCIMKDGSEVTVDNPAQMPERDKIDSIYEPYVKATMMVPNDYVEQLWSYANVNVDNLLIWII